MLRCLKLNVKYPRDSQAERQRVAPAIMSSILILSALFMECIMWFDRGQRTAIAFLLGLAIYELVLIQHDISFISSVAHMVRQGFILH